MLHLPGANLPPGGWDGLGEMEVPASNTTFVFLLQVLLDVVDHRNVNNVQDASEQVVGHFTVHGLSVSVSVNTGAGGIQANINNNNNVGSILTTYSIITPHSKLLGE